MTAPRSHRSRTVRALLATIAVLLGVIAALVGGILQRLDGDSLPQAIEYGCGVFGATVLFTFAVFYFLGGNGPGNGES
ncbi:hypothetical protein [Actinomadura rugatobispora]|uniref:Uncharacterized protein n=1 Tax=Actinomadura rugatobispora TaxID=1994 RepID=A0ABW1AAL1_9ACTN|nr:hypothetical protein GCM10010200_020700 [Actinomadura rugatobispora]